MHPRIMTSARALCSRSLIFSSFEASPDHLPGKPNPACGARQRPPSQPPPTRGEPQSPVVEVLLKPGSDALLLPAPGQFSSKK